MTIAQGNWLPTANPATVGLPIRPWAAGTVLLGDPVSIAAQTVTNAVNIASASGVGGPGQVTASYCDVVFSTPVPSTAYIVSGEIEGVLLTNFANDNSLTYTIHGKTVNGFRVSFRESLSIAQNVRFSFTVNPIVPSATLPQTVSTRYIGSSAGVLASMTLENFVIRYNTANTSLEIAAVAGTESIQTFCSTQFGNALVNTSGPLTVTTAFQVFGDPAIVAGLERRDYVFGPVAAGDQRQYQFTFQSLSATKVAMRVDRW
jgi:hypothetical protein